MNCDTKVSSLPPRSESTLMKYQQLTSQDRYILGALKKQGVLPKGKSIKKPTQQQCDEIANKLNSRPRKRLNYKTPEECIYGRLTIFCRGSFQYYQYLVVCNPITPLRSLALLTRSFVVYHHCMFFSYPSFSRTPGNISLNSVFNSSVKWFRQSPAIPFLKCLELNFFFSRSKV